MENNILQNSNIVDLKTQPYQLLMNYDTMELIIVDKNGKQVRVLKNVEDKLKDTLTVKHIQEYNQHQLATEEDSGFLSPTDKALLNKLRKIVDTKFNNNKIKIRLFGKPTCKDKKIELTGEIISDIGVYKFIKSIDLLPLPDYNEQNPFAIDILYLKINDLDKINNLADVELIFDRKHLDSVDESDTQICLLKLFVRNSNPITKNNKYGYLEGYEYEVFESSDLVIPFEPRFVSVNLPKNKITDNTLFYAPLNGELKDEVSGRYFVKKGAIFSQSPFGLMYNSSTNSDVGSRINLELKNDFKLSFIIDKSNINEDDSLLYFNDRFKITFDYKLFAIVVHINEQKYFIPVRNKHRYEFFSMSFTENGILNFYLFNKMVFEKESVSATNLKDLEINSICISSTDIPIGNILITSLINENNNDEHIIDDFILKNNFGIYDKDFYTFVEEKVNTLNNFATLSNNNLFIFDNISGIGKANGGSEVKFTLNGEINIDTKKFVKDDIVFVIDEINNIYEIYKVFEVGDNTLYLVDEDNKIKAFNHKYNNCRIYTKSELYTLLINGEYNKYIEKTIMGNNYNNVVLKDIPVGAKVKYVKKINKTKRFNYIKDKKVNILKILNKNEKELILDNIFDKSNNEFALYSDEKPKCLFNKNNTGNYFAEITYEKRIMLSIRYNLLDKFDISIVDKIKNIKNLFKLNFVMNADQSLFVQGNTQKFMNDRILRHFEICEYEINGTCLEFKFILSSEHDIKYVIKNINIETNGDVYTLLNEDKLVKDIIKIDNHSLMSLYDNDSFVIITKDGRNR